MINPKEVKVQPFYKRCFCIHKYTDSIRQEENKASRLGLR